MNIIGPTWHQCTNTREISINGLVHRVESVGDVGGKRVGYIGDYNIDFLTSLTSNLGRKDGTYPLSWIGQSPAGYVG